MKKTFPSPEHLTTEQTQPEIEAEIRRRAYELYEQRGYANGYELEDWLQAQAEILEAKSKAASA